MTPASRIIEEYERREAQGQALKSYAEIRRETALALGETLERVEDVLRDAWSGRGAG